MGDFNTLLSISGQILGQKINKETQALTDTLDELNLIFLHSTKKQHANHSSQRPMEHSPGLITWWTIRRAVVNLRNLKLYQSFFLQSQCYANENKLQAKTLKKKQKHTNMRKLNKMLLNNHWITEEIKEEIKKKIPRHKWKWKHKDPKLMECSKSSSERKV